MQGITIKRIFSVKIKEINAQSSVRTYKTHFLEVYFKDKT
jgi:hypothetical protein